ncbi:MAG: Immunoglobulin I-set domain protein [Pedosphaera sp.]|nr:Immunoglobulin I-set domain protein [Pedosphaera sp.]
MRRVLITVAAFAFSTALFTSSSSAQQPTIILSGTSYTQNFDGIGSGLPDGWSVNTAATAGSLGNPVTFAVAKTAWSSTTGQFANYASATADAGTNFAGSESATVQAANLNRALAVRTTAAFGDPGAAFLLHLQNTTNLGSFQLNLDMLLLSVQTRSNIWTVDYGIGATPTTFTSVGIYNSLGTSSGGVFGKINRTFSFGSALDNQSQDVWIRIATFTATAGSGTRPTVGIDNVTLTYTTAAAVTNPVVITSQPQSRTNNAGSTATFTVSASGTAPIAYQWLKEGTPLFDGGNLFGANASLLTMTNVSSTDAGHYAVVLSNPANTVTSSIVTLTVNDPIITTQPVSRTNVAGDIANFFVGAAGTAPISYRWYFNGTNALAVGTTNSLNLTNVQTLDQGSYSAVITDAAGSVTSSVATLTLKATPSTRIAEWDFDEIGLVATNPAPLIGTGTAALVGGTSGSFSTGTFSDPAGPPGALNSGWNIAAFPAQGTNNKTAGVQCNVSTTGYQHILLTWEERHSNTASKYNRLQYSTNGTDFVDYDVMTMNATDNSFVLFSIDLSSVPGVNNNVNFAFRLVSEFESTAIGTANANYDAITSYGTTGTIRYDLMRVFGDAASVLPSPIPLTIQQVGNSVVLSWTNPAFSLQSASDVTGPYTTISGAASPYTNAVSGAQQFFRLNAH